MSIPLDLLKLTESRAPAIVPYGGPGLFKTGAISTCPAPILMFDFEGGSAPLMPWVRRRRNYNSKEWIEYDDTLRERAFNMLQPQFQKKVRRKPRGLIDIIYFDVMAHESYDAFVVELASFDHLYYNTLALDSLQEFSQDIQTFSKGKGLELTPMELKNWAGAQERAAIAIRRTKNYRDLGVFIYMPGSENIDKDYVTDPRSTARGATPENPYSIKGSVNLPGKLVGTLVHNIDILLHARVVGGNTLWASIKEPISPGSPAHWETKDRWGRLPDFIEPNVMEICSHLYGEGWKEIYASASATSAS